MCITFEIDSGECQKDFDDDISILVQVTAWN